MNRHQKHHLAPSVALYSTAQIKNIEKAFAEESQYGTYGLMKKAGGIVFDQLICSWPDARKILVLTGKGNNAGDGFIFVRLAAERRLKITLCCLAEPSKLKGDALQAYNKIPQRVIQKESFEQLDYSQFDVIVDAMLGTGIKGKLQPPYLSVIKKINAANVPVLAIDIPTGVEADTGFVFSDAVQANLTVTFVGHKKGLYTADSARYRGRVKCFDLDIPNRFYQQHEFHLFSQNWQSLKYLLQPRSMVSHKGLFGHTLIIGGSKGMSGAAILAATAAARCGSGLTSAWVGKECALALISYTPEVMTLAIDDCEIEKLVQNESFLRQVVVIGPGLGQSEKSDSWLSILSNVTSDKKIHSKNTPQVWDADALNWLAKQSASHHNKKNHCRILTPHPGEAARLLNMTTFEINQDRYLAARQIAETYGGVCVLKGAGTIIADDKGFQVVCSVGNPGMASGGMGDVLAGIIGSLLAQGYSLMNAAMLGVCIHGEAADLAAGKNEHYRGLLASDLFKHFPSLLNPKH